MKNKTNLARNRRVSFLAFQLAASFLFVSSAAFSQTEFTVTGGQNSPSVNIKYKSFIRFKFCNVNELITDGVLAATPLNVKFDDAPATFVIPAKTSAVAPAAPALNNALKTLSLSKVKPAARAAAVAVLQTQTDSDKNDFITALTAYAAAYKELQAAIRLEDILLAKVNKSVMIEDIASFKASCKSDYDATYGAITADAAKKRTTGNLATMEQQYAIMSGLYNKINGTNASGPINIKIAANENAAAIGVKEVTITAPSNLIFASQMEQVKKQMGIIAETKNQDEMTAKAWAGIDLYFKVDAADFCFYSSDGDLQMLSDELKVEPKLKNKKGEVVQTFNPMTFYAKGGWKVNFSSGYMLSFNGNDNYTQFTDAATGKPKGIRASNTDNVTHALGGFIHAYPRWHNAPTVGLSLGIGLTEDTNLSFYGGVSAFFLEENRLVLTAGYSMLKLKRLNNGNLTQDASGNLLFTSEQDTEINYDPVYRGAVFVGITYNIFKATSETKK